MSVGAVVVAAGKGKRMNAELSKQYLPLNDKPIIIHTLECFQHHPLIDQMLLVCGSDDVEYCQELVDRYMLTKVARVVAGGEERQDSVYRGLQHIHTDWVLVHDGVRPFLAKDVLDRVIEEMFYKEAVVLAVPVKDTIKQVDREGIILRTPPRESLWAVQTPQAFRLSTLMRAYEKADKEGFIGTDDASLVERLGIKVHVTKGDYANIKITTPDDLWVAEALVRRGWQ